MKLPEVDGAASATKHAKEKPISPGIACWPARHVGLAHGARQRNENVFTSPEFKGWICLERDPSKHPHPQAITWFPAVLRLGDGASAVRIPVLASRVDTARRFWSREFFFSCLRDQHPDNAPALVALHLVLLFKGEGATPLETLALSEEAIEHLATLLKKQPVDLTAPDAPRATKKKATPRGKPSRKNTRP